MRTLLLCHSDDDLNRVALPRWLASFSDLCGLVVIKENRQQTVSRMKREVKRIGKVRFLDVVAYRLYHRLFLQNGDIAYERRVLAEMAKKHPPFALDSPMLVTASPNSAATRAFLEKLKPDMAIARCKVILKPEIFQIARLGTYAMHPGICPEYRNAHGCFWALAERDLNNVGMTLLKVDKGVDTGPVYGFFSYAYDERAESHTIIQHRTVFDNLDAIREKLLDIERGTAAPVDITGRTSRAWGQPRLTRYLAWKYAAKKRARDYETDIAALS
jgi:hypothetical protein